MHSRNNESCGAILFIFGATGDLATKKILPSLQQWYGDETPFAQIWCLGRRPLDEAAYFSLGIQGVEAEPVMIYALPD